MVKDRESGLKRHHVSNIINKNIIPSLPENCVVEVPAYFVDNKIKTPYIGSFPSPINELIKIHAKNQQLVVDAAQTGNPGDLLKAFLADPMCKFIEDDDKIEALMWNLLYYERNWLQNFSEAIPSYQDLQKMNYHVEKKELSNLNHARREKYPLDSSLKKKAWPYTP